MARPKKIKEEKYECKTEERTQAVQAEGQGSVEAVASDSPAPSQVDQTEPVAHPQEFPIIEEPEVKEDRISKEVIRRRFGPYRPPTEETKPKFKAIQEAALIFAEMIVDTCPDCQQRSTALTLLEQAKMLANASIAIHCIPTTAKKGIQV